MRTQIVSLAVWSVLTSAAAGIGSHRAVKHGHLQIHPSFTGEGVSMYPGHHPDHDADNLKHIRPDTSKELYYAQEGFRPALHGAKHGSLKGTFVRPTVVLDHSSHINKVSCKAKNITMHFTTPEALETARTSWPDDFNVVTYHPGCGDEQSGKRSFFHASDPVFNDESSDVTVSTRQIDEKSALDSGEISWGTYRASDYRKRTPVKGHVRLVHKFDESSTPTEDLSKDPAALKDFFADYTLDTEHMSDPIGDIDNLAPNGSFTERRRSLQPMRLSKRFFLIEWFEGVFNGMIQFNQASNKIGRFIEIVAHTVEQVASGIAEYGMISAKALGAVFGVPFDHTYHNDWKINKYLHSYPAPPSIFGLTDGATIYSTEADSLNIQCAKCGVHAELSVEGHLAFQISKGVTSGWLSLTNHGDFTVDVQLGLTVKKTYSKKPAKVNKELAAIPFSPLTIPGVITLGPQVSFSASLELSLEGQAQLLVGGTLAIKPGSASISITDEDNGISGMEATFTPVLKAGSSITAKVEFGIPIAFEVGLDVLTGTFKTTVGLVDTPAVYASAKYTADEGKCQNGVQLRIGATNKLTVGAAVRASTTDLTKWEHDIRKDVLYEHGIGCVSKNGFDPNDVDPDAGVIGSVIQELGGGNDANPPVSIKDVSTDLSANDPGSKASYQIIMDADQTTVLVSGTDGGIYLVGMKEDYDVSAPWGTFSKDKDKMSMDTFGRMISYRLGSNGYVAELSVHEPTKMPEGNRAASISLLKETDSYAIFPVKKDGDKGRIDIYYPTVCRTYDGLKLFATRLLIDEGRVHSGPADPVVKTWDDLKELDRAAEKNYESCSTVRLTSARKP